MGNLIFSNRDFISLFRLPTPAYEEFSSKLAVLDISDRSGTFKIKQDINSFVHRVSKSDDRIKRLELYKEKLYRILVTDAEKTLTTWFESNGKLPESLDYYLSIPSKNIFDGVVFDGRIESKYGKVCKNLNFTQYYNTKKCYANDSEYVFGLMKAMFEDFKVRNSLVCPAFFDQICRYEGDSREFWRAFMIGANRPSTFNPVTYNGILNSLFDGDTLFAPVMGWNSYQLGFYASDFKHFVSTDVIPSVVENGKKLHEHYLSSNRLELHKSVDLYLCPSEKLDKTDFVSKYRGKVDAVLLSPPYFDLEIYDSEDQSVDSYPSYKDWLEGYWDKTVRICSDVMKKGARFGFVISNYRNSDKQFVSISEDMRDVVSRHLNLIGEYKVQWSAYGGSRQASKTRNGNYEDLWLFEKQ